MKLIQVYKEFLCSTTKKWVHDVCISEAFPEGRRFPDLRHRVAIWKPITYDLCNKVTCSAGCRVSALFGGLNVNLLRRFGHQILNLETLSTKVTLLFLGDVPFD